MDDETIQRAATALIETAPSPATVILHGPHARGAGDLGVDYQFLVISEFSEFGDRFTEMARLDRILGRLRISADVTVVTREEADRPQAPGSLLHEALTRGRIIAES